jgi:hypothetical protein
MNINGKIIEIFETQKVTESFQKREFVVEYAENPSYPEYVKFELIQDRCALLDPFSKGDEISVDFNLKGRKWEDKTGVIKYFNSLQAWRLEEKKGNAAPDQEPGGNEEPEWLAKGEGEDDLPF